MSRLLLLAALTLCACDSADEYPLTRAERDTYEREIQDLFLEVEAAIGGARADTVVACRVVTINTDGCGSPIAFQVYSATDGDSLEIHRLAARHDSLSHAYSRALGIDKPCLNPVEPPPFVLEDGRCRFEPQVVVD